MNNESVEKRDPYQDFMNALQHCDTVKVILTGVGESVFTTEEIHKSVSHKLELLKKQRDEALDDRDNWMKAFNTLNDGGLKRIADLQAVLEAAVEDMKIGWTCRACKKREIGKEWTSCDHKAFVCGPEKTTMCDNFEWRGAQATTTAYQRETVLPCKVGDIVYFWWNENHMEDVEIKEIIIDSSGAMFGASSLYNHKMFRLRDIGKTVFLTAEDAEKAYQEAVRAKPVSKNE